MHKIYFSPEAKKDFHRLPKNIQSRIKKKLEFYASAEKPLSFAKSLINLPPATHRFRAGDYRMAFYLSESKKLSGIFITRIRHRREVYNTK